MQIAGLKFKQRGLTTPITATPSEINFGTVKTGYAMPRTGPKTVTITNTETETVELSEEVLQENSNYTVSKTFGKPELLEKNRKIHRTAERRPWWPVEYNKTLYDFGKQRSFGKRGTEVQCNKSGGSGSGGDYVPVQKPAI